MLQPVRTKFRKAFKGRIHGKASRAIKLNYGQFGLKAMEPERIIGKQFVMRFGPLPFQILHLGNAFYKILNFIFRRPVWIEIYHKPNKTSVVHRGAFY